MLKNLLDATLPAWVTTTFPILRMVFMVLIAICAIGIIVIIMLMESNPEGGSNVISGSNESFYSLNQSSTKEGRFKKFIIFFSVTLVVLTILFFVTYLIYPATL